MLFMILAMWLEMQILYAYSAWLWFHTLVKVNQLKLELHSFGSQHGLSYYACNDEAMMTE